MNLSIEQGILAGIVLLLLAAVAAVYLLCRKRNVPADVFEDMEGHEFEYYCADLLEQRGFVEVETAGKLKILLWDKDYLEPL